MARELVSSHGGETVGHGARHCAGSDAQRVAGNGAAQYVGRETVKKCPFKTLPHRIDVSRRGETTWPRHRSHRPASLPLDLPSLTTLNSRPYDPVTGPTNSRKPSQASQEQEGAALLRPITGQLAIDARVGRRRGPNDHPFCSVPRLPRLALRSRPSNFTLASYSSIVVLFPKRALFSYLLIIH